MNLHLEKLFKWYKFFSLYCCSICSCSLALSRRNYSKVLSYRKTSYANHRRALSICEQRKRSSGLRDPSSVFRGEAEVRIRALSTGTPPHEGELDKMPIFPGSRLCTAHQKTSKGSVNLLSPQSTSWELEFRKLSASCPIQITLVLTILGTMVNRSCKIIMIVVST